MASEVQRPRHHSQQTILVLDWDGTLTCQSTLPLIAGIRDDAPSLVPFTQAYEVDLAAHAARWPGGIPRNADGDEGKAYFASLAAVELASIQRLEAAGIWRGVTGPPIILGGGEIRSCGAAVRHGDGWTDVERHARNTVACGHVQLRPGAAALIQRTLQRHERVLVASVAWSGAWIAACLTALGIPAMSAATDLQGESLPEEAVLVVANEIDPQGSGRLNRGWAGPGGTTSISFDEASGGNGIWTAADKLEAVTRWSRGLGQDTSARMVCMGDSTGDLLMLRDAETGIIVVDAERTVEQRELEDTLRATQCEVTDIQTPQEAESMEGLWRVTGDLTAVRDFISRLSG